MKRFLTIFLALSFIFSSMPVPTGYAEPTDRETIFERTGDWLATFGKTASEKRLILTRRKARRAHDRLERMARSANREPLL